MLEITIIVHMGQVLYIHYFNPLNYISEGETQRGKTDGEAQRREIPCTTFFS